MSVRGPARPPSPSLLQPILGPVAIFGHEQLPVDPAQTADRPQDVVEAARPADSVADHLQLVGGRRAAARVANEPRGSIAGCSSITSLAAAQPRHARWIGELALGPLAVHDHGGPARRRPRIGALELGDGAEAAQLDPLRDPVALGELGDRGPQAGVELEREDAGGLQPQREANRVVTLGRADVHDRARPRGDDPLERRVQLELEAAHLIRPAEELADDEPGRVAHPGERAGEHAASGGDRKPRGPVGERGRQPRERPRRAAHRIRPSASRRSAAARSGG